MRKIILFELGLMLALISPLFAQGGRLASVINFRQEEAFLSYLKGGGADVALLDGLPNFHPGDLDPINFVTGRPCILPGPGESLHSVAYILVSGAVRRRMIFQFTLSPAVQDGEGGGSLRQLAENKSVTQYWVWMASDDPQGDGEVVGFKSRVKAPGCR